MNLKVTVSAAAAAIAASLALWPLINGLAWLWAGIGAVLVAAAVGAATRIRAIPAVLGLAAGLAACFLYLNAVFAGGQSRGGVVPTGRSLRHLGLLGSQAVSEMAKYAPAVPDSRGITLIAAAGIGVVAVVTDLLAARLRRPALAGLPLLVLFCVPLTTTATPSWPGAVAMFALGTAGFLALLSADGRERLRLWGRVVRARSGEYGSAGPDIRPLGAAGRRIGGAAMVLALCVPLLVPGLKHHQLFGGSGHGHGPGGQLALPDPLVQLNNELREQHPRTVLTYSTNVEAPPYLQLYVLSQLTTDSWTLALPRRTETLSDGPLPAVPGLNPATRQIPVSETLRLSSALTAAPNTLTYLPVPYAPRRIQVPGQWRVDLATLSPVTVNTSLSGLEYTVSSADIDPSPRQLRAAPAAPPGMAAYLTVPAAFAPLRRLARSLTAGQPTPYDKAVALQDWFTKPGNFTYTLHAAQPRTPDALIRFLTTSRRGYCQQFAFGMAVLARLLQIPSRVAIGYTQGTPTGNGAWRVTTSDAHAWPELYFQGAGWLRFEPTPSGSTGRPGQATASTPAYTFPAPGRGTGPTPARPTPSSGGKAPAGGKRTANGALSKLNRLSASGAAGPVHRAKAPFPIEAVLAAILGALLVAPALARVMVRHLRWARAGGDVERAHAAWRELQDDLADHRIGWKPSETPRSTARRLTSTLSLHPAEHEALGRMARAEERARYSTAPDDSRPLRADSAALRRAMARTCPLPGRLAALAAPASVLLPVRSALGSALDVLSWMDVLWAAMRRRFRPGRREEPSAAA